MVAKAKDFVAMPGHDMSFFKNNGIGFEGHIGRVELRENWEEIKPFLATAHLPYSNQKALPKTCFRTIATRFASNKAI